MGVVWLVAAALAGLALLWKAADLLVDGAIATCARLSVPPILVGALVVGFGTSAPEALVSTLAALEGSMDLAVGNVVGSNTANLTLVLGTAALVSPVVVGRGTLRRDLPLSVIATLVVALAVQNGITRGEGVLLLLAMVAAIALLIVGRPASPGLSEAPSGSAGKDVTLLVGGLVGTIVGAQLLVYGARGLAEEFGVTDGFIGLTLVAIGTSAPELATAVAAARRRQYELIAGNVLGSNVFNSTMVAGLAGTVAPGTVTDPGLTVVAVVAMLVITAVAAVAMLTGRTIARWQGAALLLLWLGSMPLSL